MSTATQTKSKLPSLASLCLVAALGILGAKLMWLIIAPKQISTHLVQSADNATIKPKEKINYGKLIANHHLFGEVVVKKAAVAPPVENKSTVAPTKLNLKLHGIVSYKNSENGYALISSSDGAQKVYGKGDELQKGVTVSDIFSDKVVLDNRGKTEDLLLPRNKNAPSNSKYTQKKSTTIAKPPTSLGNAKAISKKTNTLDLGAFRRDVQANPQKILDIATPSAAIKNGKFLGFRLRAGRKRDLFHQLGFRSNDIITEVNGIILDDASKGPMVLGELAQASNLSITVQRGSQIIFIQHSF